MQKRAVILSLIFISVIGLIPRNGEAEFPEKPIQILVGYQAGSQNDSVDRAIASELQNILGKPVIVQNVPGGGAALVLGRVKVEKADGYTLFQSGTQMYARTPHLRSVPYDPFKDFAYLAQHMIVQYAMVDRPNSPWKNFEELIAFAKNNPKKVKYATSGVGSTEHVFMEYLGLREKLDWIHVPFLGVTEAVAAVLGGHVELYTSSLAANVPDLVKEGRLRVLLSPNPKRLDLYPEVPSILEKGYDYACEAGNCFTVPANTPKPIQQRLESALLQSFKAKRVIEVIEKWNCVYMPLDAESLRMTIERHYKINGDLLKKFGLGIYKKD